MKKQYYNNLNKILTTSALVSIFLFHRADASTIFLKNDDTAEVDVIIEAGSGNVISQAKEAIRLTLKEGEEKKLEITKNNFDKETFTITGKVKMPSLYNNCTHLLIDKNYKIIFTGSKTGGVVCIAEQLN